MKKYKVFLGIWCYSEDECNEIYAFIKNGDFSIDQLSIGKPIENLIDKWTISVRTTTEVKKDIKKQLKEHKIITDKNRYF